MIKSPLFSVFVAAFLTLGAWESVLGAETVYDASRHGVVSGPLSAPREAHGGAVDRLLTDFEQARADLDAGRLEDAARSFDGVFEESGWPEAAYNASLAHYGLGRYDLALERAETLRTIAPDDLTGLHLRGVLLRLHGRHADALDVTMRALDRAVSTRHVVAEAMSRLNVAWSHRFLGDPEAAATNLLRARETAVREDLRDLIAASWMLEGHLARDRGDREASESAFEQSREAGERNVGAVYADIEVKLLAAEDALSAGKRSRARSLIGGLHAPIRAEKDVGTRAMYLLRLAELELATEGEEGSALLDEAEKLFTRSGLEAGRADVLDARSRRQFLTGDVQAAEETLLVCLQIREALQAPLALAGNRLMLAQIRAHQGRMSEALELAVRAGEVLGGALRAAEYRAARLVEADIRLQLGEAERAAQLASDVAREAEAAQDSEQRSGARITEILARLELGESAAAAKLWNDARKAASPRQTARVHLAMARRFETDGRPEQALNYGRRVLEAWDAAAEGSVLKTSDILDVALTSVINALLVLQRGDEAEAVLAARGRNEGELGDVVRRGVAQARLNAGVEAYRSGEFSLAREVFVAVAGDQGVELGMRESARKNLATVLQALGREALEAGGLADAERWYLELLDLALGVEDPALEANTALRLADIRLRVEDPTGAAQRAEVGALAAARAKDGELEGALWALAGDAVYDDEPERARGCLQRALAAWGSGDASLRRRAAVTYNLALLNRRIGDGAEAVVRAREARVLAERAGLQGLAEQAKALAGQGKERP